MKQFLLLKRKNVNPFDKCLDYDKKEQIKFKALQEYKSNFKIENEKEKVERDEQSYLSSVDYNKYWNIMMDTTLDLFKAISGFIPANRLLLPAISKQDDFKKIVLPKNVCQLIRYSGKQLCNGKDIELKYPVVVGRFEIEQNEILKFRASTWLSDDCINGYNWLITEKYTNCHAFNTIFYTLLKEGYHRVKRHTKKVNIFQKDVLIIPIHHPGHWALCIVLVKYLSIIYIDSMGNHSGNTVIRNITNYLIQECNDKSHPEGKEFLKKQNEWKSINLRNNPQQNNGNDCGVFSIMGGKAIAANYSKITKECNINDINSALTFNQSDIPYWRARIFAELMKGALY